LTYQFPTFAIEHGIPSIYYRPNPLVKIFFRWNQTKIKSLEDSTKSEVKNPRQK